MDMVNELLWGKTNPYTSLFSHMTNVGLCVEVYLEAPSSAHILQYLSNNLNCSEEYAIRFVRYLFTLHDIGKCHPRFQRKDESMYQRWKDAGYGNWFKLIETSEGFRHEYWSAVISEKIWRERGWNTRAAEQYAAVLRLHHQKNVNSVPAPKDVNWLKLGYELENRILSETCVTYLPEAENSDAVCTLLTSLLIVCDWIVSSPLLSPIPDNEAEIKDKLKDILYCCGIGSENTFPAFCEFGDMFPEITTPRPLQKACEKLSPDALLTIIEAPMGEGKTEAALYTANLLCRSYHLSGVYMALPTQATSNQMFKRIEKLLNDNSVSSPRLLHGTAFLQTQNEIFGTTDEEDAAKWMRPLRMGFLVQNAVGTVDQAMATVLLSKFSLIRFAGLENKVLIIDEIHAYDMYMSQIIEILLKWCSALNVPVILLSATLQNAQKRRYLQAYGATETDDSPEEQYPLITQVLPDKTIMKTPTDAAQRSYYHFQPMCMNEDDEMLAEWLVSSVSDGGCIAVIVNTVRRAQQIYNRVTHIVPDDITTVLFHARFTIRQKADIEKRCVSLFGKDRTNRPAKGILIATQVVEQSIDLDFDGMISELAPVDLLLQRAGRLHRHRENQRPDAFKEAVMQVLVPSDNAPKEHDKRYGVSGIIYEPFLMYNTEIWLGNGKTVHVPEDIRITIERVYTLVTKENADDYLKREMKGLLEGNQAKGCILSGPSPDTFFPVERPIYFDVRDTNDGFDSTKEAATRLADTTMRVAFVPDVLYVQAKSGKISPKQQIEIYLDSVSLRYVPEITNLCNDVFQIQTGLLKGIWIINSDKECRLGNKTMVNDSVLGVYWKEC